MLEGIKAIFKGKKIILTGGPKPDNLPLFSHFTLVALNEKEACASLNVGKNGGPDDFLMAGERILAKLGVQAALITRGEKGMSLFLPTGKTHHVPALATQVFDVSGAGDTVISVATAALASGATFEEATRLSNIAAAIVVRKLGTATVNTDELIEFVEREYE